jgi:hypothetical protein
VRRADRGAPARARADSPRALPSPLPPSPHQNRLTRLSYLEAEGTIRQLLREITQIKGAARALEQSQAPPAAAAAAAAAAAVAAGAAAAAAAGSGAGANSGPLPAPPTAAAVAAAAPTGGRPRRGDLVRQVAALQAVAAAASGAQAALQSQVEELAAEKERVEGNERLVSETAATLLAERRRLMDALAAEKDAVREMEAGITSMAHQVGARGGGGEVAGWGGAALPGAGPASSCLLAGGAPLKLPASPLHTSFTASPPPQLSMVLDDREVLLEHLARLMKPCDLEQLMRDMHIVSDDGTGGGTGPGSGSASGSACGSAGGGSDGGGGGGEA